MRGIYRSFSLENNCTAYKSIRTISCTAIFETDSLLENNGTAYSADTFYRLPRSGKSRSWRHSIE